MNNMICRKLRSRKGKKYFYCSKQRTEIPLEEAGTVCAGCPLREYRQQTPLHKTPASARAKAVSISPKVKKGCLWSRSRNLHLLWRSWAT